jgi:hypothetical protein
MRKNNQFSKFKMKSFNPNHIFIIRLTLLLVRRQNKIEKHDSGE